MVRHRSIVSSSPFAFSASLQLRASTLIHQQRRAYSQGTAPNQQQVFQSFGTPFVAFLLILSRIARIIVVTGLAGVTILAVGYEGTHMYVEYVAMPRAAAAAAAAAADGADEYDWSLDYIFSDHNGLGSGLTGAGTDPRLGFKARHLVRAAWIATEWGGGLSPSIFFAAAGSSTGGAGSVGGSLGSASGAFGGAEAQAAARFALRESMRSGDASIDKGLKIAEQYLDAALNIAENKRAIPMVPDPIAIRRQGAAAADGKELVDPTAAALEMQLASVRARIGSPQKIYQAIGGFERLYDAYSFQFQQRRAAPADTEERQRLIHLANRIGGLYAALGKRDSAEAWYMRGIDAVSPTTSASADNFATLTSSIQAPKTSPAITRSLVNSLLGLSVLYATPPSANQQQQQKKQTPTARDAAPETGSLQIDAAYRAGLEKALGAEMAALKLLRLELHGLSHSVGSSSGVGKREKPQPALASLTSPDDQLRASEGDAAGTLGSPRTRQLAPASGSGSKGGEDGRELYWLWLLQQDGQTSMLIAETIYALQLEKRERQEELLGAAASASGGSAGALLGALRGAFGGAGPSQVGSKGKHSSAGGVSSSSIARNAQSIAWLQEAESAAERVYAAVAADHSGAAASGKGKKGSKAPPAGSLAERWSKVPPLEVVARRLLRDSRRMEQNAGEMIGLLERST